MTTTYTEDTHTHTNENTFVKRNKNQFYIIFGTNNNIIDRDLKEFRALNGNERMKKSQCLFHLHSCVVLKLPTTNHAPLTHIHTRRAHKDNSLFVLGFSYLIIAMILNEFLILFFVNTMHECLFRDKSMGLQ